MSFIFILLMAAYGVHRTQTHTSTNYCQFCKEHPACNATTELDPQCRNASMVAFNKCWILSKHNEWRNKVAGGLIKNLKPACRMSYMQWDDELTTLAAYNVGRCRIKRDICLKSVQFLQVSQHLGNISYNGHGMNVKGFIQSIITKWHKEAYNVTQRDLVKAAEKISQFSIMMRDETTHIGCAAVTYKEDKKYVFLLVCNYGISSMRRKPAYEVCEKPGEKCVIKSMQYKNLCGPSEILRQNLRPRKRVSMRFFSPLNPWFNPGFTNNNPWFSYNPWFTYNPWYNPFNNIWYDPGPIPLINIVNDTDDGKKPKWERKDGPVNSYMHNGEDIDDNSSKTNDAEQALKNLYNKLKNYARKKEKDKVYKGETVDEIDWSSTTLNGRRLYLT